MYKREKRPRSTPRIIFVVYVNGQMSLIIYASELSACVGMNKYKSVEEVRLSVWQRWDPPSFRVACEPQKSAEEVFASLGPSVRNLVSRAVSSETEHAATTIVENAMNEKANVATDKAVEAIRLAKSKKQNVDDACKPLVGGPEIAVAIETKLKPDCSATDVKRVIDSVLVKDVKEAKESVVREVNTRRGIQNEHKGIASYEKSKRVKLSDKNSTFYKKRIGETGLGTPVFVGGRVDGLTPDKVIEVKCRRNHFFNTLPIYEKVQIQTYLFLTSRSVAEVVQKYDGATRSDEYAVDIEFWGEVCAKALVFASELEKLF